MGRTIGSKNKTKIEAIGSALGGSAQTPYSFGGVAKTAAGSIDVQQASSFFYSPELTTESWLLPKSRQEILKWARIFFNLEPYVQSITMRHSLYPFSKFELNTPDKSVTQFYNDMAFGENFDLYKFILQASLSYQKFGEAIMFGNMEKDERGFWKWSKFVLLEPELVEIKSDLFEGTSQYELIPTPEMQQLIKSNRPEDMARVQELEQKAPEVVQAVRQGRFIRLDSDHVSSVARITDPSSTRGTSPIQCLFKVLIYQDWIRLAQSAFAQRYIFPVELWTIGDLATNRIPDEPTLQRFRDLINQAIQNPPFSMVFPPIVKYEALSSLGKFFPINNEYEYIHDQIMVGMGVNKNLILGEGPSFSNVKTMALHALMQSYKAIRDEFENWILYKFFAPIARKNNFYRVVGKKKELILPTISWYKSLDIEQEEAERENFHKMHSEGFLSTKTLFSKYPTLDYSTEQKQLEDERGTIWDKGSGGRLPAKVPKTISKPKGGSGGSTPSLGIPSFPPVKPTEPEKPGDEPALPGIPGEPIDTGIPEEIPTDESAPDTSGLETSEAPVV
jgi:hypothetical protein